MILSIKLYYDTLNCMSELHMYAIASEISVSLMQHAYIVHNAVHNAMITILLFFSPHVYVTST